MLHIVGASTPTTSPQRDETSRIAPLVITKEKKIPLENQQQIINELSLLWIQIYIGSMHRSIKTS